jgi:protein-tyrosine phosphatase
MDSITEHIWIGNSGEAKDRESLQLAGIRSILCLDGCMTRVGSEEAGVDRIEVVELIDGSGNRPEVFLRAVRLLRDLASKHPPVLVHCYAGRSRSAAVVCKYFMQAEGNSLVEAMRRITTKRKVAIAAGLQDLL